LYRRLVDEVAEAELVGVLELEFVVVGEEAEKGEGLDDGLRRIAVLDELVW